MSQQLQTTSTNLPNQLSKQQSSLIKFVDSEDELQVVKAVENSVMIGRLEDWTEILKVVSKWRLWIGIPKKEVDTELSIATEFIAKTYPHLTVSEIELAYTLSISRKLEDVEFFGYFSPMYIGKVLDSYLYWRKITMADAIRRREKFLHEQEEIKNRPTPEQQCESTKEMFLEYYNVWKETNEISDPLSLCYNYLRKQKMLKLTQQEIDEALEYAKNEVGKKYNPFIKAIIPKENQINMEARCYCVKKFFQNVDIDVLLNNIKPEHFS